MANISVDVRMINSSGIGTYIKSLLPRIINLLPEHKYYLLGNVDEILAFEWTKQKNVDVINTTSPIYSTSEQLELIKKIPAKTDIFWSPHYNIPVFYTGKLLVTIHDILHLAMPQYAQGFKKQMYSKTLFNLIKLKSKNILTPSNFSKEELTEKLNYSPDAIYKVPNAVDEKWFNIKKQNRPYAKPYLLYVGNVKPHKNLNVLIKAFKMIKEKIQHDIVIVGKKEGFILTDDSIQANLDALNDRVHFTGYVEDDALNQYYAHAEMFVFPSVYEGFGIPPLEAMATKCPVIVSNANPMPEVCGDAALYFDPYNPEDLADKILSLNDNLEVKNNLIELGLSQAKKFSWDKSANTIKEVIEMGIC